MVVQVFLCNIPTCASIKNMVQYSKFKGGIVMAKTSSAVKNKWNDKAYDRINLTVPKGQKDTIKEHADTMGESVNGFIQRAIRQTMESDKEG